MTRRPLPQHLPSRLCSAIIGLALLSGSTLYAADLTWDGGSLFSGNDWNTSILGFNGWNWNPNGNPGTDDNLSFAGSTKTSPNNNTTAGTTYAGLTFNTGAAAFTLVGNRITLGANGITNNSGNLQTVNMELTLGADRTVNAASGAITIGGAISGNGGLTKEGSNTLTLTGTNAYGGPTAVNAGTLVINGNNGGATGTVTVASGATLAGSGTVGGATSIAGGAVHSAGAVGDPGTQTFSNALAYASGSIFQWDLDAGTADTGAGAVNSGSYDQVVANGTVGGTSIFTIVLGTNSYTDAFWNTDKSWSNIFSGAGTYALASLFTSFGGSSVTSDGLVDGEGHFSFNGNTLNWTAIPELSNLLVGAVLGAGMLRRKRQSV